MFSQVFDEGTIYDQQLTCCVSINTNDAAVMSSVYGIRLERRMLDKILKAVDNENALIMTTPWTSPFLLGRDADRLFLLLRLFSPIPNRINKFKDLIMYCSTTRLNQFC